MAEAVADVASASSARLNDWLNDPTIEYEVERLHRRTQRIERLTLWMRRIPVVGSVVYVFWSCLLDEGWRSLRPRWGALTFAFLNDGISPTLYHTWRSIRDPRTPIYPMGAPRSALHERLIDRSITAAQLAAGGGGVDGALSEEVPGEGDW